MKIAFIVTGLEPGRDGVGDYIRGLSLQLAKFGHQVRILALNDRFTSEIQHETPVASDGLIRILRMPQSSPWKLRFDAARLEIDEFVPDWLSLQFVCFGYQSKGFVWPVINGLSALCRGYRLHWMFHELWVGLADGLPWKHKFWGRLQKCQILHLYRTLRPQVTQTNNLFFAQALASNRISATILPLFGSIPLSAECDWFFETLRGLGIVREDREKWAVICVFGTIPRDWNPGLWLRHLAEEEARAGRQVLVVGIGRVSGIVPEIWKTITMRCSSYARFLHVGEQPAERVSQLLSGSDYGVAMVNALCIGKSSAVAAMLDHGLPVLVPRWDLPTGSSLDCVGTIYRPKFGLMTIVPIGRDHGRLTSEIAYQMLELLESASAIVS